MNEENTKLENLIVGARDDGGKETFYRSPHELIFAFKQGTAPHINCFDLGQHGGIAPMPASAWARIESPRVF